MRNVIFSKDEFSLSAKSGSPFLCIHSFLCKSVNRRSEAIFHIFSHPSKIQYSFFLLHRQTAFKLYFSFQVSETFVSYLEQKTKPPIPLLVFPEKKERKKERRTGKSFSRRKKEKRSRKSRIFLSLSHTHTKQKELFSPSWKPNITRLISFSLSFAVVLLSQFV